MRIQVGHTELGNLYPQDADHVVVPTHLNDITSVCKNPFVMTSSLLATLIGKLVTVIGTIMKRLILSARSNSGALTRGRHRVRGGHRHALAFHEASRRCYGTHFTCRRRNSTPTLTISLQIIRVKVMYTHASGTHNLRLLAAGRLRWKVRCGRASEISNWNCIRS